nr:hypothetical protein [Vibrio splendidus]MCC4883228.1 hypothetical protein [Vibrio splendidus]
MTIKKLIQKYQISDADIDQIWSSVATGEGLAQAKSKLPEHLTSEAIYSIARELCLIEMGEAISEVNPQFVADREKLNASKFKNNVKRDIEKKQVNIIKKISEDIDLCIMERSLAS